MIHLQLQGLGGNNLFQYAVARLLAEDFGYSLEVAHSVKGDKANTSNLTGLLAQFEDGVKPIPS